MYTSHDNKRKLSISQHISLKYSWHYIETKKPMDDLENSGDSKTIQKRTWYNTVTNINWLNSDYLKI